MPRRSKTHRDPGNVLTLSGIILVAVGGHAGAYRELVENVTKNARRVQDCGCIPQYRSVLSNGTGFHIASLIDDDNEARWFGDRVKQGLEDLEVCLKPCKRR